MAFERASTSILAGASAVVQAGTTLVLTSSRGVLSYDLSLKRWILPVWVFGSSLKNLTERGYL
jgi:hypothetical protein